MTPSSVDILARITDLTDGLVLDDLGSERAMPLAALLVFPAQDTADFSDKTDRLDAVLDELVATNGADSTAPALVALLRTLDGLGLWVGEEGTERAVWIIGTAPDDNRVGIKSAVVWT